jgi:dolichyl-phosphate-mannose--protein O-mannosyl transferase
MSYQYFIFIPYYNQFVSIFFGSIINIYTWITFNCLLTKILTVSGHVIIILIGVPIIINIVIYLRKQRIEFLMDNTMDKINNDIDALIQINMIKDLSISRNTNGAGSDALGGIESEMKIKGILNLHFEECKQE